MSEVARIDPSAPYFAALLADRAGDGARAEALYSVALKAESSAVRRESAKALVARYLAPGDAESSEDRRRKAVDIARALFRERQDDASARTLLGEALAAAGEDAELKALYGENGALAQTARDFSFALIAAVRTSDPNGRDRSLVYFLDTPVSSEHRRTYRELKAVDRLILSERDDQAALGRLFVYDRSYRDALYFFRRVLAGGKSYFYLRGELLADLGKAFLYGGAAEEGAGFFLDWEESLRTGADPAGASALSVGETNAVRFRLLFYAARMRKQVGDSAGADLLFTAALPLSPDAVQRDACVWYLLDNAVSLSPASAVPLLRRYAPSLGSSSNFTDFLDRLCSRLVAERDWPSLLEAFRTVRTVADSATIARYAYVIGRAVSLGYIGAGRPMELLDKSPAITGSKGAMPAAFEPAEIARRFFRIAFESDSASFYYRCLAASHLGENVDPIPAEERMNDFDRFAAARAGASLSPSGSAEGGRAFAVGAAAGEPTVEDELAFLLDFFAFGCADLAMPYAQEASPRLDPPAISALSEAFAAAGRWGDSLRFISQLQKRSAYRLDRRDMQLLYPHAFAAEIGAAASLWGVSEPILFGLVRTESAFIPDVVSRAGAVGLAQLMPATAADVASRIGKKAAIRLTEEGPDLRDPATNTVLGAWYLADQTRRAGSPLMALLGYNGGPSRVRRWRVDLKDLPEDLFLETIPVAETQNYGRKVLAASAVYGYLYYGMTLERVVADIFPK